MNRKLDSGTILRWTGRAAFFCLAWALILFTLFLVGNYQRFLDSNQQLIMALLSVTLLLALGSGLLYLLLLGLLRHRTYHPGRRRVIILIVALALSFLLFVVLEFFHAWLLT